MKRFSTPDKYTNTIMLLRILRQYKRISPFVFAAGVARIWELRHGRA